MKHEIFNEPDRHEIIWFMLDWLDTRIYDGAHQSQANR
jgi:alpha-beta hydrolase superfamily lysophospholipase